MMEVKIVVAALCATLLAGCASAPAPAVYAMTTPFREADYAKYAGAGSASLSGQAFLKTVGGDVKTCAGNKVSLVPGTAYSIEMLLHTKDGGTVSGRDDSKALGFDRHQICDASGHFSFEKVPPGQWYVATSVTWGVPTVTDGLFGPEITTAQQGGNLAKQLTLASGQNQVILVDADRW